MQNPPAAKEKARLQNIWNRVGSKEKNLRLYPASKNWYNGIPYRNIEATIAYESTNPASNKSAGLIAKAAAAAIANAPNDFIPLPETIAIQNTAIIANALIAEGLPPHAQTYIYRTGRATSGWNFQ